MAMDLLARRDRILAELGAAARDPRWGEGWVLRARIHLHQGELGEVFRWAGRAVSGGFEGDWMTIRSEALRLLGDAARRRGDLAEAARLYERCIALPDNPHGASASLWGLGDVARQRGDLGQARDLFDRSLRLYEEIGDAHGLADHRIGLADLARQRRDVAAAESFYLEATVRFEELGNRYGMARGLNGLGEVSRLQGNLEEAGRLYRRSRSILAELSSADEIFPRVNLAFVSLAEGHFGRARRELEESRSLLGGMGWGGLLTCVHAALLSCAAQARDWSFWDDGFAIVSPAVEGSGIVEPDLAWAAELAGRLTEWAGETARAKAVYGLARAQWRALGDVEGVARMERALAGL
jgi:tetratricopeptide (TPR) repeat protein